MAAMETVFGLIGLALYVIAVIALAAGVTYLVIRLTPTKTRSSTPET